MQGHVQKGVTELKKEERCLDSESWSVESDLHSLGRWCTAEVDAGLVFSVSLDFICKLKHPIYTEGKKASDLTVTNCSRHKSKKNK